jgi:hypothetical protein
MSPAQPIDGAVCEAAHFQTGQALPDELPNKDYSLKARGWMSEGCQ